MKALLNRLILNLPEVSNPSEKKVSFKTKLKWTLAVLVIFYFLGLVPLYGLGENSLRDFEFLSLILAADFGSLISLGIGPIVTASILLQLLNGSGVLKFDLTTPEGKRTFQGVQKMLAMLFVVVEAIIYVMAGGLRPEAGISPTVLITQLIAGGMLILFMDEVISKWGFGQGVSLFIVAGVSKQIFVRLLSPFVPGTGGQFFFSPEAAGDPAGAIFIIFNSLRNAGEGSLTEVYIQVFSILMTVTVFAVAVFVQAMKVEVPLSFGRIRGQGIRWPLSFLYASNIPVILVGALIANLQLLGSVFKEGFFASVLSFLRYPELPRLIFTEAVTGFDFVKAGVYAAILMVGSAIFSVFWVKTAGMDPKSQAKNIMNYGLQIPGFRRDERVLESLLKRYIPALTVMGGLTVGFLAAAAEVSGTLTSGIGLLLAVMILFRLYEEISQQHAVDMNPMLKKFMKK